MKEREGATKSIWYEGLEIPSRGAPPPTGRSADVCVVGAGIAGLTVAYLLAREGKRVVVLDEGPIGSGQTGRTTGHLVSASDDRFAELEHAIGERQTKLFYESHAAAIELIEAIAQRENIACEFARIPGYLLAADETHRRRVEREHEAACKAGIAAELVQRMEIAGTLRGPCIRFRNQARFHPMRYLVGLAEAAERAGATIHEGVRVAEVHGRERGEHAKVVVRAGLPFVAADVVVATNTPGPIKEWAGVFFKQAAYRTYVIGLRVPRGTVEDALLWDSLEPYHYVRLQHTGPTDTHDVLVVGGEDHRVGQLPDGPDPFTKIEAWARAMYPMVEKVAWRWSGQIQEPADGPAFIGRAPTKGEGVYAITGDSGMGLTHATLGAQIIGDLVMGRENPWADLYDPERKPLRSLGEYAKENLNTARQWIDLVTAGDVKDESEIPPGCGRIVRHGVKKLAVYRDDDGTLHTCSAVCPHLEAIVQWNPLEKSWDCPAHGSRFAAKGELLMGPAVDDLKPAEIAERPAKVSRRA
jgi:glycine/D-amino acid oxidase-like deaminating enzyme/nitrite reductase/ring-hydroxylating ferredoxin subunit